MTLKSKSRLRAPQRAKRKVVINSNKVVINNFKLTRPNDVLVTLIYHKPQICWILLFLHILPVKSRGLKLCVFIFRIFSFLTFYFLFSSVLFTLLVSIFSDIYFKYYQLEGYGPGRFCFFRTDAEGRGFLMRPRNKRWVE